MICLNSWSRDSWSGACGLSNDIYLIAERLLIHCICTTKCEQVLLSAVDVLTITPRLVMELL